MFFDPATVEAVRNIAPAWLVILLTVLSFLGSATYQVPMLLSYYFVSARETVATWLAIVAGSYSFRSLLKNLNDTSRPPVDPPIDPAAFPALVRPIYSHPAEISTTSFPSGHALAATVLWGLLVVDTDIGTRRQRLAVAVSVVAIVAVSRVVLGAHYIEDIVAGTIFGLVFLGIALVIRKRSVRPVAASFALAALVSLTVLAVTTSDTGTWVLGVSLGVLAVIHGPTLLRWARRNPGRGAVVGASTLVVVVVPVFVLFNIEPVASGVTMLLAAMWYWLPQQPAARSVIPALRGKLALGKRG